LHFSGHNSTSTAERQGAKNACACARSCQPTTMEETGAGTAGGQAPSPTGTRRLPSSFARGARSADVGPACGGRRDRELFHRNRVGEHVADHSSRRAGIGVCDARERLGRGRRFFDFTGKRKQAVEDRIEFGAGVKRLRSKGGISNSPPHARSHPQAAVRGSGMLACALCWAAESARGRAR